MFIILIFLAGCDKDLIEGEYGCKGKTQDEVERCENSKKAKEPPKFVPMDNKTGW